MEYPYQREAQIFKALSDPKRLAVLELLKSGEKCACVLMSALRVSQSGLSYHMKILCEAGVVESWPVGKWTHYQLNGPGLSAARALLEALTGQRREGAPCGCAGTDPN